MPGSLSSARGLSSGAQNRLRFVTLVLARSLGSQGAPQRQTKLLKRSGRCQVVSGNFPMCTICLFLIVANGSSYPSVSGSSWLILIPTKDNQRSVFKKAILLGKSVALPRLASSMPPHLGNNSAMTAVGMSVLCAQQRGCQWYGAPLDVR